MSFGYSEEWRNRALVTVDKARLDELTAQAASTEELNLRIIDAEYRVTRYQNREALLVLLALAALMALLVGAVMTGHLYVAGVVGVITLALIVGYLVGKTKQS